MKPKETEKFSIKKRAKSFVYAAKGFKWLLLYEHNARIHLVAAIAAVSLGFILKIGKFEWLAIILVIAMVFFAEMLNSAIEYLADTISEDNHPLIGMAKDVAAGAVLLCAIAALVVGSIVFVPEILKLYS